MNLKKILPLVIAVVLGLVAARMAMNLVSNKVAAPVNGTKVVQIVMAKQNVAAGQELTADDLTVGPIAIDAPPDATFKSPGDVVGRVASVPLLTGQALLASMLAPKGTGVGMQALVPKDMRTFTIQIDEFSGLAGYITPGCHVDVIQSMHGDTADEMVARTIMQYIKVTAVGSRKEVVPGQDPNADQGLAHSLTLLVTPEQAELLELATKSGDRPSLTLRNADDNKIYPDKGITLIELRGETRPKKTESVINPGLNFSAVTPPAPAPVQQNTPAAKPEAPAPAAEWVMEVTSGKEVSIVKFPLAKPGFSDIREHEEP